MMSTSLLYCVIGALLFGMGFYALFADRNLIKKVLAFNVMGSGSFLILVAGAYRGLSVPPDPVPHALVLTGIVVAVSATAVFVGLVCRISLEEERLQLPEDEERD